VPDFGLRPARQEDFGFARELYLSSMKPLLQALDAWNEEEIETAFRGYFDVDEIRVVILDDEDVGWIQISHTDSEVCLDQLHLVEASRDRGIGTALIARTIDDAAQQNKNVSLSLVKGNRAIRLYKRLGFHQVAEDNTKIHKLYLTNTRP
jgi:ribosomal protein S18 acetylase RimI-like enzyme